MSQQETPSTELDEKVELVDILEEGKQKGGGIVDDLLEPGSWDVHETPRSAVVSVAERNMPENGTHSSEYLQEIGGEIESRINTLENYPAEGNKFRQLKFASDRLSDAKWYLPFRGATMATSAPTAIYSGAEIVSGSSDPVTAATMSGSLLAFGIAQRGVPSTMKKINSFTEEIERQKEVYSEALDLTENYAEAWEDFPSLHLIDLDQDTRENLSELYSIDFIERVPGEEYDINYLLPENIENKIYHPVGAVHERAERQGSVYIRKDHTDSWKDVARSVYNAKIS